MSFRKNTIRNKIRELTQKTNSFIKENNTSNKNKNKYNNFTITSRHKFNFKTPNHYIKTKYFNQNKSDDKNLFFGSEKNILEKNSKNILFNQIKKLIAEFEEEKTEEKIKDIDKNKNNKKNGSKKTKLKKPKPKGLNKLTTLVIPQKKVYYMAPKVKTQMQLNRYLINDFKENDSVQDYIKRSKKYQKMNEEFDELIFLKQIKEAAKNGVSEKVDKEKGEEELFDIWENVSEHDSEINSEEQPPNDINTKILNRKKFQGKRNSIFSNNHYNLSLRRLYTDNIKDLEKINLPVNKTIRISNNNQKNISSFNHSLTSRILNPEKESLTIDINDKKKLSKSTGIKYLMNTKKRRSSLIANMTKYSIISKRGSSPKLIKKKTTTRKKESMDKYTFSNKLYKEQINDYNKYLRNKQIMRGKNFSKQLALFEKEKEKFGIIDNEENEGGLPKLNHTKLLYQLEFKDIFKNSFNTMRVFEEGDQDLDLDNLNKNFNN